LVAAGCETKFDMGGPETSGATTGTGGLVGTAPGTSTPGQAAAGTGGAVGTPAAMGMTGTGTGGAAAPQPGEPAPGGGTGGATPGEPTPGGTGGQGEGTAGSEMPGPTEMPQTCPATSTLRAGETTETIQVGATSRRFILHVPRSYTGQTPVPLILDFHGILMNSGLERAFSGFADLSETEGFIVAFPEGTDTAFNVGICCTSSAAVDDVAFARAIVAQLSQRGCIDQKRIHSVGYSMGGGMSMHLACNAADLFASIAYSAFDMMPEQDWPCTPSRPIPALAFRSTGDPIVPYRGAANTIPPNGNPNLVTFIGAEANLTKWGALDGCTGTPEDAGGGCKYFRQCSGGAEVGLCTKQGGGHDYMPAAPGWAFLKQHPMP
jgi:polyhydroxybutyrate depolymerase